MYADQMVPLGNWMFFCTAVDSVVTMNYGFRYYTNTDLTTFQHFGTRSDNFYTLNYPSAQINLGGIADPYYTNTGTFANCYCTLQYFRFFMDYVPTTPDQMLNLAMMNPSSKYQLLTLWAQRFLDDISGMPNWH